MVPLQYNKKSLHINININKVPKNFFLYCSCIALVWTPAIQRCTTSFLQLAENLQATCSSCKKTCTAVVLRLCGLLQYNKIFVLLYCTCVDRSKQTADGLVTTTTSQNAVNDLYDTQTYFMRCNSVTDRRQQVGEEM